MVPGTWRMRSATTGMIGDWTDCIRVSRTAIASKSGRVARGKTGPRERKRQRHGGTGRRSRKSEIRSSKSRTKSENRNAEIEKLDAERQGVVTDSNLLSS